MLINFNFYHEFGKLSRKNTVSSGLYFRKFVGFYKKMLDEWFGHHNVLSTSYFLLPSVLVRSSLTQLILLILYIDLTSYRPTKWSYWKWVHSSLQPKCHHEILFAKLNLKVEYYSFCLNHSIWSNLNDCDRL